MMRTGTIIDTRLGKIRCGIVEDEEMFPLTQSMMVVTSPIGDRPATVCSNDNHAAEYPPFFDSSPVVSALA